MCLKSLDLDNDAILSEIFVNDTPPIPEQTVSLDFQGNLLHKTFINHFSTLLSILYNLSLKYFSLFIVVQYI